MPTQTFDFNQADEDPFSDANWDVFLANPGKIVSNAWAPNGANSGIVFDEGTINFADDQYSQAEIQTDGLGSAAVIVRGSTTTGNGYGALASATALSIRRYDAGSPTVLASQGSLTISAGDVIKLVAEGSTLTAYQNDVQRVQTTDSTYTTGQPGLFSQRAEAGTNAEFDNWEGSDNLNPTVDVPVAISLSELIVTPSINQQWDVPIALSLSELTVTPSINQQWDLQLALDLTELIVTPSINQQWDIPIALSLEELQVSSPVGIDFIFTINLAELSIDATINRFISEEDVVGQILGGLIKPLIR